MIEFDCPCCGCNTFHKNKVLWKLLVREWGLSKYEVSYIDRQQGFCCDNCNSNLRSMTLAQAIMSCYSYEGLFKDFVRKFKKLKVLEINEAGNLTKFISQSNKYILAKFPEVDMMKMPYADNQFDLVIHSDTLEHIPDAVRGLSECRRVMRHGGFLCYTVPTIVGRLSIKRRPKQPSYHGDSSVIDDDYLVHTEYGSDMWKEVFVAGFKECRLVTINYPASIAIVAKK